MAYYVPSFSRVIGVFNAKTQYGNFSRKNLVTGTRNVKIVSEFIKENHIDYLGTQELTKPHQDMLAEALPEYTVYGGYRFGDHLAHYIPGVRNFNESNAIISKYPIDQDLSCTLHLPSIPTIGDIKENKWNTFTKLQPRIMTIVVSKDDQVIHVNTHLHDAFAEKRAEQEQFITEKISELQQRYPKYAMMLTGDFNDTLNSPVFQGFVTRMQMLGFTLVPIVERTYSKQKENLAIDHIFINQYMRLEDCKVIKDEEIIETSDHYPVLAKVKLYKSN